MNSKEIFELLISPAQAAILSELEESTIRKAIKNGILIDGEDCTKIGKQWIIYKPSLEKLKKIKSRKQKQ